MTVITDPAGGGRGDLGAEYCPPAPAPVVHQHGLFPTASVSAVVTRRHRDVGFPGPPGGKRHDETHRLLRIYTRGPDRPTPRMRPGAIDGPAINVQARQAANNGQCLYAMIIAALAELASVARHFFRWVWIISASSAPSPGLGQHEIRAGTRVPCVFEIGGVGLVGLSLAVPPQTCAPWPLAFAVQHRLSIRVVGYCPQIGRLESARKSGGPRRQLKSLGYRRARPIATIRSAIQNRTSTPFLFQELAQAVEIFSISAPTLRGRKSSGDSTSRWYEPDFLR